MPNGGPTPDRIHCKHFQGELKQRSEHKCQHHNIKLAFPIRAFCKTYEDPQPAEGVDWLDMMLERNTLKENIMYVWLGGYDIKFFHVELASVDEYSTWQSDRFLEELGKLSEQHLDK